jgi:hypothetical protein
MRPTAPKAHEIGSGIIPCRPVFEIFSLYDNDLEESGVQDRLTKSRNIPLHSVAREATIGS